MEEVQPVEALRLDQYIVSQSPELSRSFAAQLIESGKVIVNQETVTKPSYRVREADVVLVDFVPGEFKPPPLNLPVIYEDEDCVVINKPAGVLTHSKGAFNPEATVATWLSSRWQGESGERAGIVHRLDRATSGVMICAKTSEALSWLQKQFSQRKVKKSYRAIVKGEMNPPEAIIDMPIERNPRRPQNFRVGAHGKTATTHYKTIRTVGAVSELELRPQTGRTHQLRVHLQHQGHPIVGDTMYDGPPADRMYLHANSLEVTLPSKKRQVFEAPVPVSFEELMTRG